MSNDEEVNPQHQNPGARVFLLNSPLKITGAYSRKDDGGGGYREPSHFITLACAGNDIIIKASPTGSKIHVYLNGKELK